MDLKQELLQIKNEVIRLRRDFHMYPELGFEEYRTSEIIVNYLTECGIEVSRVAKTGVVGLLKGQEPGHTIMLRADMDALPVQEMNDVPYKSQYDGKMHACGHDGHVAMLLGAAKILAAHQDLIKGNVKFVFQPNEEVTGAMEMIDEGVLENPKVESAFGIHLWSPLKSGTIGLTGGPVMAANEEFDLTIIGRQGHTSAPQEAVDPVLVASTLVQSLQSLQTREHSPLTPTLIMIGQIHGGTGRNIIPDRVQMGGTIRFLYENESEERKLLLQAVERHIAGVCQAMRAEYVLNFIPSNPSVKNDPAMVELVSKAAREAYGQDLNIQPYLCLAGDDFAYFTQRVPSAYYFLGIGNADKGTNYPHHHPCFDIDEDVLIKGTELHVRTVLNFFR